MFDFLIKNGTVIDGSGSAGYRADVAITDGKIACIAGCIEGGKEIIDATGLMVTPGFIDAHSHSDMNCLSNPEQTEKGEQGITTSISGQCGQSPYPVRKEDPQGDTLQDRYETFGEFLEKAKNTPQGSNEVIYVGHGRLRRTVIGMEKREPTAAELEEMKALLRDGMEHGALGISFGLVYTPSCYAKKEELIELCKVVAEYNGIAAAHLRNEADTVVEAVEEFLDVLKTAKVRGCISHHKAMFKQNHGKVNITLPMIQKAIDEGVDVYCDVYPYIASGTTLESRFIPDQYRQGADKLRAFLSDPQVVAQIKQQNLAKWGADLGWVLVNVCPSHPEFLGKNMNEVAEILGMDTFDAVYELLRQDAGAVSCTFFAMAEEDVEKVMKFPRTMICTDSRAHGKKIQHHPRLRGSFPRALGVYVRERKVLSWEEMIHRMTDMPATFFGLKNKGLVKVGYDADLCIFDPERIIDKCDFIDCLAHAEGLNFVLVNGQVVAKDAYHTGARPGCVITDLAR